MRSIQLISDGFVAVSDGDSPRSVAPYLSTLPDEPTENDAEAYGIQIERAHVETGQTYWRAARIHHLTPAENHGNHHLYLDVLDPNSPGGPDALGERISGARLRVMWEGEEATATIDKPLDEPGANFPMWRAQTCSVEVIGIEGETLPSDRITGLHVRHFDEAPGNTWGHHSFHVTFVRALAPLKAKPLAHYVLFGPAEAPSTAVHLLLAQEYLLTRHPVFGFSPVEAASARQVTIIADEEAVAPQIAAELAADGAMVQRISGTPEEIMRALSERVRGKVGRRNALR